MISSLYECTNQSDKHEGIIRIGFRCWPSVAIRQAKCIKMWCLLFCSSNNHNCGDFVLLLIASCTQCTHKPLECQDSAGLLNKCSRCSKCILHHAIACNRYFMSTGHLFFVSSTDKDVHLRNHLQKLLCVSPFLFHLDPISECENMRSWWQKGQRAALGLKLYSSKSLTYDQPFDGNQWQDLQKPSRTRSLKVFRNGSTECPKSFWQFRSTDQFWIAIYCDVTMSKCVQCRVATVVLATLATRLALLRSLQLQAARADQTIQAAVEAVVQHLTFLRHLTWTQHSCQWLGSVGDLSMLLHNSVPFEASLSVVWIAWELWSVSM